MLSRRLMPGNPFMTKNVPSQEQTQVLARDLGVGLASSGASWRRHFRQTDGPLRVRQGTIGMSFRVGGPPVRDFDWKASGAGILAKRGRGPGESVRSWASPRDRLLHVHRTHDFLSGGSRTASTRGAPPPHSLDDSPIQPGTGLRGRVFQAEERARNEVRCLGNRPRRSSA